MDEHALPTTLDAWLARLEAAHPVGIDLGLERVAAVAGRLGLTAEPIAEAVITVAGTNGKGSTVAMLEALGRAHGMTTAAYTSPHLVRYNERLRLDGREASDAVLMEGFARVEQARLSPTPVSLTYFEVGTLAALWTIAQAKPQLAVLEVGLGGRLDAVNVVDPDVAVVTTVAQDHAAFLGNDITVIGREKAGIMRSGKPAVLGSTALPDSVPGHAARIGATVFALGQAFQHASYLSAPQSPSGSVTQQDSGASWSWQGTALDGATVRVGNLPDPGLPRDNAASALQALWLARGSLEASACQAAFAQVSLPGRMQWQGRWCLDVGHNPHAAAYLATRLHSRRHALGGDEPSGRLWCLIGMLEDKDADGVLAELAPVVDGWVPVTLEGARGRPSQDLAARIEQLGGVVMHQADTPDAGADWLESRFGDADDILVTGSFFTVAAILARWERQRECQGERQSDRQTGTGNACEGAT
ncbi:MAG: folylpolyglutamate synthase/dihydrofolate synthase family protein [Pseudomonadota bacterium]|nr:folylpolyglutamate synthase/dihydrofolate synthase family protein [Pseudomonadota bacterium]